IYTRMQGKHQTFQYFSNFLHRKRLHNAAQKSPIPIVRSGRQPHYKKNLQTAFGCLEVLFRTSSYRPPVAGLEARRGPRERPPAAPPALRAPVRVPREELDGRSALAPRAPRAGRSAFPPRGARAGRSDWLDAPSRSERRRSPPRDWPSTAGLPPRALRAPPRPPRAFEDSPAGFFLAGLRVCCAGAT